MLAVTTVTVLLETTLGDRFNVKQWVTMAQPWKIKMEHVLYKASSANKVAVRSLLWRRLVDRAVVLFTL